MQNTKSQAGFTLLELVVVVAILAIVGGGILVSYDGLQSKAAKSSATHSIAAVDGALRSYRAAEGLYPSDLDSLVAGEFDASNPAAAPTSNVEYLGNMGSKLKGKFSTVPFVVTGAGISALNAAGITNLRYVDRLGNGDQDTFEARIAINLDGSTTALSIGDLDGDGTTELYTGTLAIARRDPVSNDGTAINVAGDITFTDPANAPANVSQVDLVTAAGLNTTHLRALDTAVSLNVPAADGSAAAVNSLANIDIPNRVFDTPREGNGRNRGRGWSASVQTSVPVALWKAGAGGINNVKVGALEDDVLVAFGIGNNCTMIGTKGQVRTASLSQAPFYSDVAKNEYGRYIGLFKIGTNNSANNDPASAADVTFDSTATLVAVLDPRGDFLDEEQAEATGQKQ